MEQQLFGAFLLFCISFAQSAIPFSFNSWTRTFQSCSLHLMLAEWVNPDKIPFQETEQPYQLLRITPSFVGKKKYAGLPYTRNIQCKASFIYEVTTKQLELALAGSIQFGGSLVKYIFVLTFHPEVVLVSTVKQLYSHPHLLVDFTRLYILHVEKEQSTKYGLPFLQVFTVCPHKAGVVQICPVETTSMALTDLEFERRGRMMAIPYYPFALVPYRCESFYDSVWTDFGSDDVETKVSKEIMRSVHLGFSNQSIDYEVSRKTLNSAELSRRSRISRGELKFTGGAATFIPTNQKAFGFITCYEQSDRIAFRVYLEPFTFCVWLSTALTSALLAFVLVKLFKTGNKFLNAYMNLILALVEQYSDTKGSETKELKNGHKSKAILLTLWLLAALTLSNAYKGILTANVAAPVPNVGIETFEQLHAQGFEIYSPLETSVRVYASSPQHWKLLLERFRKVMKQYSKNISSPAVRLTVFGHNLKLRWAKAQQSKPVDYLQTKYLWKDAYDQYLRMLRFPKDFPNVTVEQVVASCGKAAYVDYDHQLGDFEPPPGLSGKWRDQNRGLKLSVGSEKLLNEQQGWLFAFDFKGGGLLSSAFRRLTAEAGIHAALSKRFKVMRRSTLGYMLGARMKNCNPLQLDANLVQGLFILYATLLLAGALAFAVELCTYRALKPWRYAAVKSSNKLERLFKLYETN